MAHLSVNVNKLATLRNSRGKNNPDVTAFAAKILAYGAHGITVHPRPDGRHIRLTDVTSLRALVAKTPPSASGRIEFNIEGYPSEDFLNLIDQVRPDQATLVPDPPDVLTSNAGWDLVKNESFLVDVQGRLREAGARVSLFVDPQSCDPMQMDALARIRPDRIELYTEKFADDFSSAAREKTTELYARIAKTADQMGIGINAGHDLNQDNLGYLAQKIPALKEVSIGHALICEALEQGMEVTIKNYLRILKDADRSRSARP